MTKKDDPGCERITGESILRYLEHEMPPDEIAQFERHVQECLKCSERKARMEKMISTLKMEKEAFCPEPWELHDYVMKNRASPELIWHVDRCSSCKEQVEAYKLAGEETSVPPSLRDAFKQRYSKPQSSSRPTSLTSSFAEWFERIRLSLNMPMMALGTAAAVVLLVVVFYPRGDRAPVIGLSSVYWPTSYQGTPLGSDQTLSSGSQHDNLKPIPDIWKGPSGRNQKPIRGDLGKPTVAIVLAFKGFKKLLSQERIDDLYRDLAPPQEVKKHYHTLDPAQIEVSIRASGIDITDRRALLRTLRKNLSVSYLVVIDIISKGDRFDIEAQMIDTDTEHVKMVKVEKDIANTQLATSLRKSAFRILPTDK